MNKRQLRQLLRYAHLGEGFLIVAFIYSSSLQASSVYAGFIQFVVIPAVITTGILLWQQPKLNKFINSITQDRRDKQPSGVSE